MRPSERPSTAVFRLSFQDRVWCGRLRMSRILYFATAARGTEEVLAEELRALGAEDVTPRWAGVEFTGPLELGYRVCLWSRVASRVLLVLGRLGAPSPSGDALYEGVRGIDWSAHIDPRGTLAV